MLNQVRIRIISVCLLIPVFLGLYFIKTYDWRPGLVSIAFGSTATSDGMSALLSNLTPDQENVVQLEHVSFVDPEADGANGGGVEAELTQEGKRAAEAKEAERIVAEQTAAEQIAAEKATTEQIAAEEKAAESRAAEMPAAESVVAMSADSTLTSEHEAEHSNSDSSDSIKADNASAQEAGAGTVIEGGRDMVIEGEEAVWFDNAPWKAPVGRWFQACGAASQLVAVDEVVPNRSCPEQCNGNGVCNHDVGQCRCTIGFKGPSCGDVDVFPCNYPPTPGWPMGPWVVTVCAAECDTTRARCQCGTGSPFPTRSMDSPCGFTEDESGRAGHDRIDSQALNATSMYHSDPLIPGWCFAQPNSGGQPLATCDCLYEGRDGFLCETPTAQFCLGGCNNRGECDSGYCKCRDGWFGIDCSLPSAFTPLPTLHQIPPPWLEGENITLEHRRVLGERGGEDGQENGEVEVWKGDGGDGVRRVKRKRPLIYVYDLLPEFNSHVLQGRPYKFGCVPWSYDVDNNTRLHFSHMYGMEIILLDSFLSSPHRTVHAGEADFFYVPLAGGCIIERADDSPRFEMRYSYANNRPSLLAEYVERVLTHIRSNYSFWDRHQGRDHLWTFPWDEGACFAPSSIWSSTLLSPWGNTHTRHKGHTTVYPGDDWSKMQPEIRGDHPCFDPEKDVVMPPYKNPEEGRMEDRMWERPFESRPLLFYFSGQLGHEYGGRPEKNYSMGIRQEVARHFASIPNLDGQKGFAAQHDVIVSNNARGLYSKDLSSSRFCGVFPGDGFSARMEDSMLHGCIPVIIQDGITMPYENVMDYTTFAIRVAEKDIPNLVKILEAIPESRVRSMLGVVRRLSHRWSYYGAWEREGGRQGWEHGHTPRWAELSEEMEGADAVFTLMEILHYKLHNDPWRQEVAKRRGGRGGGGASGEGLTGVSEECMAVAQSS